MIVGGLALLLMFADFRSWNVIVGMAVIMAGLVVLMYASSKAKTAS